MAAFVLTVLVCGCFTVTMVRFSPGFTADEELLDTRLNKDSQAAIRSRHEAESGIGAFYLRHLAGMLRGDFGFSRSMQRPVRELLAARLPVTMQLIALGIAGGNAGGVTNDSTVPTCSTST